jgi:hypothetical protein
MPFFLNLRDGRKNTLSFSKILQILIQQIIQWPPHAGMQHIFCDEELAALCGPSFTPCNCNLLESWNDRVYQNNLHTEKELKEKSKDKESSVLWQELQNFSVPYSSGVKHVWKLKVISTTCYNVQWVISQNTLHHVNVDIIR